jgi:hypothetical protein
MGRRPKDDGLAGALFELVTDAVAFAWRSRPLYGLLTGLALAGILCWGLPALFKLVHVDGLIGGLVSTILGLFATVSQWAGGIGALFCFICAFINLFRNYEKGAVALPASYRRGTARTQKGRPDIPFLRKDLMTPTELIFFNRLRHAFPDMHVCPQVALAAVVDIPAHFNNNEYKHVNRAPFAAKYADFAIIDPETGDVHAIIELDDHTHDSAERQAEDAVRDAMLEEVGIPVHRFDARKMPSSAALAAWFPAE